MVALRSRRLESLFGASLDSLQAGNVHALVMSSAQEAFDLDFKGTLYGRGDSDRRALAGDVAAMANTAGGVIVLGVAEDEQARAVATPGVQVTDAEVARIRQVIASLVAPMPVVDVLAVPGTGRENGTAPGAAGTGSAGTSPPGGTEGGQPPGFIVIAVPRSPAAPHAVLVNEALRYPRRNGPLLVTCPSRRSPPPTVNGLPVQAASPRASPRSSRRLWTGSMTRTCRGWSSRSSLTCPETF